MSAWRTMESAPRDGTWVLLWGLKWALVPNLAPCVGNFEDGDWYDDHASMIGNLTHWQPLPEPPVAEGEG